MVHLVTQQFIEIMERKAIYRISSKILTILALTAIVCIVPNCKKKDLTYTISGNIHDVAFNNNLSGAKVQIQLENTGNSSANKTVELTTGADGSYSYTFTRDKFTSIEITVSKNMYFTQTTFLTLDELELNGTTTINYNMNALSWVRLHFTGNGSQDITYYQQQGLSGCAECCPSGAHNLYQVSDESIICINNGNTLYEIYYFLTGTTTGGPVGVVTVPFDTTDLNVSY